MWSLDLPYFLFSLTFCLFLSRSLCSRYETAQPTSLMYYMLFKFHAFLLFLYFFITALLRYNSNTIHLTYLHCVIQWFLVYSESCATTITVNFRTFSSPQKETLYPLAVNSHFFPNLPVLGNH